MKCEVPTNCGGESERGASKYRTQCSEKVLCISSIGPQLNPSAMAQAMDVDSEGNMDTAKFLNAAHDLSIVLGECAVEDCVSAEVWLCHYLISPAKS